MGARPKRSPNLNGALLRVSPQAGKQYQGCALPLSYGGNGAKSSGEAGRVNRRIRTCPDVRPLPLC